MGLLRTKQRGTKGKELVPNLTRQDLCDADCPAAGYAVVVLNEWTSKEPPDNVLVFCRHHLTQHEPALAAQGAFIYRKEEE